MQGRDHTSPGPPAAATRRPYVRPTLEVVNLLPEEAVLAGCKPGPGPQGASCNLALGAICRDVTS
ncbi:MAG: hypothetical protein AB1486_30165 [Planctomycetota bacterium]